MNKKYELTDDTIEINGVTLYRIKALKSFSDVNKDDLGGFVRKFGNLLQSGNCWIYHNACVFENARLDGNACVYDECMIYGKAKVYDGASVRGFCKIYGKANICRNALIYGKKRISKGKWVERRKSKLDLMRSHEEIELIEKGYER